jgi:hypothetical protein
MSRLKCKRRNGYLVCYPHRRNKTESIIGGILLSLGVAVAIIMTISLFTSNQETFWVPQSATEATSQPAMQTTKTHSQMPETENEASKLQAVEYLNRIRGEEGIPPVQLIDLSVARYRAEYLARTNLFSHYDSEGRHPGYWYTRLDGGLYGVEENLFVVYTVGSGRPSARIAKINYSDAIYNLVFDDALSLWGHRDSLLDSLPQLRGYGDVLLLEQHICRQVLRGVYGGEVGGVGLPAPLRRREVHGRGLRRARDEAGGLRRLLRQL